MFEDGAAQLDGSWDWQDYKNSLIKYTVNWIDSGYFYEDILTLVDSDLTERYATGQSAFILGNDPSVLVTCLSLNPEANYIFLPSFASAEGGAEHVGIGEGDTFGIWKDTQNEAAAKAFLEYMARPEVAVAINDVTGKLSCLQSSMEIDDSYGLCPYSPPCRSSARTATSSTITFGTESICRPECGISSETPATCSLMIPAKRDRMR